MKAHVYRRYKPWSAAWETAAYEGLKRLGFDVDTRDHRDPAPCDLAVVWSMHSKAALGSGKNFICMENGYYLPKMFASFSINGLHGRGWWPNKMDGNRWRNVAYLMKPWKRQNYDGYALVMGQMPGDASHKDLVDIVRWVHDTAARYEKEGYRVKVRPHPLVRQTCSLIEDLEGAERVITFNSNSGVDALLYGLPIVSCDPGSMVWNMSSRIGEAPKRPNRQQWAFDISYRQWSLAELESGEALDFFLSHKEEWWKF